MIKAKAQLTHNLNSEFSRFAAGSITIRFTDGITFPRALFAGEGGALPKFTLGKPIFLWTKPRVFYLLIL